MTYVHIFLCFDKRTCGILVWSDDSCMNQGMDLYLSDINNNLKAIQSILEYLSLSIQKGVITLIVYYQNKWTYTKNVLVYLQKLTMLIRDSKYEIRDLTFELTNEIIYLKSCVLAISNCSIKRSLEHVLTLYYSQITDSLYDFLYKGFNDLLVKMDYVLEN